MRVRGKFVTHDFAHDFSDKSTPLGERFVFQLRVNFGLQACQKWQVVAQLSLTRIQLGTYPAVGSPGG